MTGRLNQNAEVESDDEGSRKEAESGEGGSCRIWLGQPFRKRVYLQLSEVKIENLFLLYGTTATSMPPQDPSLPGQQSSNRHTNFHWPVLICRLSAHNPVNYSPGVGQYSIYASVIEVIHLIGFSSFSGLALRDRPVRRE